MLLNLVPIESVQRTKRLVDKIDEGCVAIFKAKKAAVARRDEELMQKVGEGKDVISLLRALFDWLYTRASGS